MEVDKLWEVLLEEEMLTLDEVYDMGSKLEELMYVLLVVKEEQRVCGLSGESNSCRGVGGRSNAGSWNRFLYTYLYRQV